jgi:hypothetical protein
MSYLPTSFTKIVTITAAQVLTLNSSPVQIAPGIAGQVLVLESSYIRYNYNSTPFNPAAGDNVVLFTGAHDYSDAAINQDGVGTPAVGFVDQSQNMSTWMLSWLANNSGAGALAAALRGSGLYLTQYNPSPSQFPTGTNWTQGNGTLTVFVRYGLIEA